MPKQEGKHLFIFSGSSNMARLTDIAHKHPEVVKEMEEILKAYKQ